MNWYLDVLKNKYAAFDGRARRTEYWMFTLFNVIASVILMILDNLLGTISASGFGLLGGLYTLAILVPAIALTIRRLHDTDRSGWWFLIAFVPFIGGIVLLVFMVMDSTPGSNKYGANPKGA